VTRLNFGPPVTAFPPIGGMECGWYGSTWFWVRVWFPRCNLQ